VSVKGKFKVTREIETGKKESCCVLGIWSHKFGKTEPTLLLCLNGTDQE
jgi:hypothetical protein